MSGVLCAVVGAVFVTSCSTCDGVGSLSEHDMSRSEAMIVSAVGIIFLPPPHLVLVLLVVNIGVFIISHIIFVCLRKIKTFCCFLQ